MRTLAQIVQDNYISARRRRDQVVLQNDNTYSIHHHLFPLLCMLLVVHRQTGSDMDPAQVHTLPGFVSRDLRDLNR